MDANPLEETSLKNVFSTIAILMVGCICGSIAFVPADLFLWIGNRVLHSSSILWVTPLFGLIAFLAASKIEKTDDGRIFLIAFLVSCASWNFIYGVQAGLAAALAVLIGALFGLH